MENYQKKILWYAGGALLGLYILNKSGILHLFGQSATDQQNQTNSDTAVTATQNNIPVLQQTMRASYSDADYLNFAQQIYNFVSPGLWGLYDAKGAAKILCKMINDLDVSKLIVAFGTRLINEHTTTANMGLLEAVQNAIDNSYSLGSDPRTLINSCWASNGIKYTI